MILCGLCNARGKKYKRNNASFVSPIAWPLKTTDISSKTRDIFFSIFREKERKKRKNGELKRNEKKKNLIRYFANHKEIITFAAYNL